MSAPPTFWTRTTNCENMKYTVKTTGARSPDLVCFVISDNSVDINILKGQRLDIENLSNFQSDLENPPCYSVQWMDT